MAFWHIANSYGVYLTIFLVLENILMLLMIINCLLHYIKVRKLEEYLKND